MPPTYTVSTYDVDDDPSKDGDWTEVISGVGLWALRPIVRELYSHGYSSASILVSRD